MGVPTFYRWLCCRYPRVVVDVGEGHVEQMREEIRVRKQQRRARRRAAAAEQRALLHSRNNSTRKNNRSRSSSKEGTPSTAKNVRHSAGKDNSSTAPGEGGDNTLAAEEGKDIALAAEEGKDLAEAAGKDGDSAVAVGAAGGDDNAAGAGERRGSAEASEGKASIAAVTEGGVSGGAAAAAEAGGDNAAVAAETAAPAELKGGEEAKDATETEGDAQVEEEEEKRKEEKDEQQQSNTTCKAEGKEQQISQEDEEEIEDDEEEEKEEPFGYDCLYLDMNGIIHPCCHTDDGGGPTTEEEMFLCIFQYIDRIVDLIQPRQLLYMAIDGVAPRAKMNQQRSRRFKTAKDIADEEKVYEELKEQFIKEGRDVPPKKIKWDSNVITPGTPFMHRLSVALTYYIQDRIASREIWKNMKVIFSDATVPGEGEHKIMDFIRQQRKSSSYQPNLWHVLHGADADLIMLGLATHERNFCILREAVVERTAAAASFSSSACTACGAVGHAAQACPFSGGDDNGKAERKQEGAQQKEENEKCPLVKSKKHLREDVSEGLYTAEVEQHRRSWKPLQMLQLPILREYLQYELITVRGPDAASENLERCIDDFVFLCFLCGNDFLPHLPHQSIQRGSIDALVELYIHLRPHTLTDYLTNEGTVNYAQLEVFLQHLSAIEEEVIRRDLLRKSRIREKNAQERQLQQQKELLGAARAACMKVQKEHQKKGGAGQDNPQAAKEDVLSKKKEQQPMINGADGGSAACHMSNACAAKLLKTQLLSQRDVKEESSSITAAEETAKVEGVSGTKQETGEETNTSRHITATASGGGGRGGGGELKKEEEATTTAGGVTEEEEKEEEGGHSGSASVPTDDVRNGDATVINTGTIEKATAASSPGSVVGSSVADSAAAVGCGDGAPGASGSNAGATATTAGTGERCVGEPDPKESATERLGGSAEDEAARGVDGLEKVEGEDVAVSLEKKEEVESSMSSGAGEGEAPPSKRARVLRRKKKTAGGKKQKLQEEKIEPPAAAATGEDEDDDKKHQIEKKEEVDTEEKEDLFFDDEEEEDMKVIKKNTKEENYDMFKAKLTERLGSTREIEGSILLQDAVEGGIGCNTRSNWRLLYYQYKFHLPSQTTGAVTPGKAAGSVVSHDAAAVAGTGTPASTATGAGSAAIGSGGDGIPSASGAASCGGVVAAAASASSASARVSPTSPLSSQQSNRRSESSNEAGARAGEIDKLAGEVARMYLIGLQWVLYYYYQGCRSFAWFYPFHYAPLAVDLAVELHRQHAAAAQKQRQKKLPHDKKNSGNISTSSEKKNADATQGSNNKDSTTPSSGTQDTSTSLPSRTAGNQDENSFFKVQFDWGEPFSAFEQLMAVLPPYSAGCMPEAHAQLMRDPLSPIADFYPLDVEMDPNGKRYQWQWVVLLPFIDEERLLKKCKLLEQTLTAEERMRNRRGHDQLYVHHSHPLAMLLSAVHSGGAITPSTISSCDVTAALEEDQGTEKTEISKEEGQQIPEDKGSGFTGKLLFHPFAVQHGQAVESPIHGLPRLLSAALCCMYTPLNLEQPHRSVILEGAKPYEAVLDRIDLQDQERRDRSFSGAVARRIVMHTLQSNYRNTGSNAHMRNAAGYPFYRGGDGYNRGPLLRYMPDVPRIPCDSIPGAYYPGAGGVPHPPPHMLQHPGGYPMPPLLPLPAHMNSADARGGGGLRNSYYIVGAGVDPRMLGVPPAGVPAVAGRGSICYNRAGPQQQYAQINPPPPYPPQQQQQSRPGQQSWHMPPQQHPLLPYPGPGQEAAGGWKAAPGVGGGMSHPFPDGTDAAQTAGFRRGGIGPPAAGGRGIDIRMGKQAQGRRDWGWDGRQQTSGCPGVLGAPPANYNAYDTVNVQQQRSQQQPGLLHWGGGAAAASNVLPGDPWMQQYTANAFGGAGYGSQAILPHQQQVQQQTQFGQVQGGQPHMWNMKPRTDVAGGWWSAAAAGQRGAPTGRRSPAEARARYGTMNPR